MGWAAERFDQQADRFDRRAGVGVGVGRAVAHALLDVVSPGPDGVFVEIGAGTGEIGRHLAARVHYLGVDRSRAMLEVFRAKESDDLDRARVQLAQADAQRAWPVRDGTATAVFASRAAHLLEPGHVVAEVRRVCRPGGFFLVGRIQRDPFGPRSRLRGQRQRLLRDRGILVTDGGPATQAILDRLVSRGASRLDTRTVRRWTVGASPDRILRGWAGMTTMGGVEVSPSTRGAVLAELREWASREFGDLSAVREFTEAYTIDGVRIGGDVPSGGTGPATRLARR